MTEKKDVLVCLEDISKEEFQKYVPKEYASVYQFTDKADDADVHISSYRINKLLDWNLFSVPLIFSQNLPLDENNLRIVTQYLLEDYMNINIALNNPNNAFLSIVLTQTNEIVNGQVVSFSLYDRYVPQTSFEEYAIVQNKATLSYYNSKISNIAQEDIIDQFKHACYLATDYYWLSCSLYLFTLYALDIENFEIVEDNLIKFLKRPASEKNKLIFLSTLLHALYSDSDFRINKKNKIYELDIVAKNNLGASALFHYASLSLQYVEHTEEVNEVIISFQEWINYFKEKSIEGYVFELHRLRSNYLLRMFKKYPNESIRVAMTDSQESLKWFTKENYPQKYAEIQMNLGILFAEMPSYENKVHIYAGLSQNAFSEALHIFNKFDEPEMYATLNTNIANAYLRLLPNVDSERFAKIQFNLHEALSIRTKEKYPNERAITLLTYINLIFHRIETAEEINKDWVKQIEAMANEVISLTHDEPMYGMACESLQIIKKFE